MGAQDIATAEQNITPQQDEYIAFIALGGLLPDENSAAGKKMTLQELAFRIDVNPSTMWRWRHSIPGFWDLVAKKRQELGSKDRLSRVWNGVYLRAVAGNADAAKLYLANFDPSFKMPSQTVINEAGESWVELLRGKKVIEGQVLHDKPADNSPAV